MRAVSIAAIVLALASTAAAAPLARGAMLDARSGNWKGGMLDSLSFMRPLAVANATVELDAELVSSSSGTVVLSSEYSDQQVESASPSKRAWRARSMTVPPVEIFHGQATVFHQDGVAGACGRVYSDDAKVVAIDPRLYEDLAETSSMCGRTLTITNVRNGKSTQAIVSDSFPESESVHSLDLSVGAFEDIADLDVGIARISWHWSD